MELSIVKGFPVCRGESKLGQLAENCRKAQYSTAKFKEKDPCAPLHILAGVQYCIGLGKTHKIVHEFYTDTNSLS